MRKVAVFVCAIFVSAFGCAGQEDPAVISSGSPAIVPSVSPAATESPSGSPKINDHGTRTFTGQNFELEMELDDFYFEPTFVKSPGGATAMVKLHNEGSVPHTFTIDALNADHEVAPNKTMEFTLSIGTETRYEFYCRFHKDQGMRGALQPH